MSTSNAHPHYGYQRIGHMNSVLNNPRYRIIQSSLSTLMQLQQQEEDEFKAQIYENSIVLLKKELCALATLGRSALTDTRR